MIYLDNAATTYKKPECVREAVFQAIGTMGNPGRGAHEASLEATRMIYGTRARIAELFGADDGRRVAFTLNGTESLNIVLNGLIGRSDHVITTCMEHNSVLRPLYRKQKEGMKLDIVGCCENGVLNYEQLEGYVTNKTKAVVCTHASNVTGNIVDIKRVGALCRQYGVLFIVDAAQTAGVVPIDVQAAEIDVLCFTGHKSLYGPQGTGGIWVKTGVEVPAYNVGGSGTFSYQREHPEKMPEVLEAGTMNGHGIAGLHAALGYIDSVGQGVMWEHEKKLMRQFYEGIKEIPGIKTYGDFNTWDRAPIVSINYKDYDSAEITRILDAEYNIAVRAGAHCAPLMHQALGTKEQGTVRFSFSWFNTEEETEEAVWALKQLIK